MSTPPPSSAHGYRVDRLRLRHLRLLDSIHQAGSLGGAARLMQLSQPAVTVLLRELEEILGSPLVIRSARGGRLSPAGVRALQRLRVALASVDLAVEAVAAPSDEPWVRLGCVQIASFDTLPHVLARLNEAGAPCRIHLQEGGAADLLRTLLRGELDCVIAWMDETVLDAGLLEQLQVVRLWQGSSHVVVGKGHPRARSGAATLAELAGERWVMHQRGSRTHASFQQLFMRSGMAPPPLAVECPSIHTALNLVAHTDMVGIAPDRLSAPYRQAGLITLLSGPQLALDRIQLCCFCLKQQAGFPGVARLIGTLEALYAGEAPEAGPPG